MYKQQWQRRRRLAVPLRLLYAGISITMPVLAILFSLMVVIGGVQGVKVSVFSAVPVYRLLLRLGTML